jgi:hypothetical protein
MMLSNSDALSDSAFCTNEERYGEFQSVLYLIKQQQAWLIAASEQFQSKHIMLAHTVIVNYQQQQSCN